MKEENQKDLIIIGAGINGLSAGLAYALNNDMSQKRVLIVEKNHISGGYVTSYSRKGFDFDTCQMSSNVSDILDYFGIELEWKEFKRDFIKIFKAVQGQDSVKTIALFSGKDDFEKQLIKMYPKDAVSLRKFFDYSSAMFYELYHLKYAPKFADMLKMLFQCPKVIKNAPVDFAKYYKKFNIKDPEINLIFQVFSSFCGLPNNRIAALLTVGVMYSLLEKAYRPEGLFIELPQKMEQRYLELGGELQLKTEVAKIIVEKGQAKGICLKDGSAYYSYNILSTIDVKKTIGSLVGTDIINQLDSRYAAKIENVEMSTSAFAVNLGLDDELPELRQLRCGYALLTSGNDAFMKNFSAYENNEFILSESCFHLGLSCPPVIKGRKPVLSIQAIPSPMMNWKTLRDTDRDGYLREKNRTAEIIIGIVEKYLIPNLKKHIAVIDISTPATYARYSGSASGSIYDMASVPENFGRNRVPVNTPVSGLLLPKFAHGVFGAMNSGLQAIDILMDGKIMQGNSRFGQN